MLSMGSIAARSKEMRYERGDDMPQRAKGQN